MLSIIAHAFSHIETVEMVKWEQNHKLEIQSPKIQRIKVGSLPIVHMTL